MWRALERCVLFSSLLLGLVDHCLRSIDVNLDAAVGLIVDGVLVTGNRISAALAFNGLELSVADTMLLEEVDDGLSSLQRQRIVDGIGTGLVGVAIDVDAAI